MTIAREFFDYQRRVPAVKFDRCSPALIELRRSCLRRWDMTPLGCYGVRPIRLGELPSTHSYGAAIDLSYRELGRERMLGEVMPWLIGWSKEWALQAVHDYVGCRIWRAGRTGDLGDACDKWWKAQRPDAAGMGKEWADYLHLEVTPAGWADPRDEDARCR